MKTNKIHIVGGGIIGLCAAWFLKKEGYEVTIIDKDGFSDGTSYGNLGMIVPSHFVPMAAPGVISKGLRWLVNGKSPFNIKPRLDWDLIQWLWHFYRSANSQQVEASMPVLYELNERSKELYKEISTENGFDFGFEERGLLMLFKTQKQAKEEESLAQRAKRIGVKTEMFDSKSLRSLEPEMELDVLGGIYFPGDAQLHPNQFMTQMTVQLKQLGVSFIPNISVVDFKNKGSKIEALILEDKSIITVENVLLSLGCWTGILMKNAGLKIHLQNGNGYSFTFGKQKLRPHIPTILTEARVAVTPMGDDLRIGGTFEMSRLSEKINQNRIQGIKDGLSAYYKNLDISFTNETRVWKGYRPCTPDGMPYIGKSNALTNLVVATGHGMMGLSLGAVTGKLISQIMTEQATLMDLFPFRLNRF